MFTVAIDFSDLDDLIGLDKVANSTIKAAMQNLASATYSHLLEGAQSKLHTRRKMFIDGLSMAEDEDGSILVSLDASVRWIDDGLPEHSMLDALLASPKAKTAKDGSKYIVVPFQHNKLKQEMTPAQRTLLQTIKQNLADVGAKVNGIEMNKDGTPRLGLVRKMDIMESPIKTADAPGQGHGAIGDVRQGPTGIPFLQGVRVYQNEFTKKDGSTGVNRSVMTFRVASSKMKDAGNRWIHPGLEPVGLFEEAVQWAREQFDQKVGPAIAQQIAIQLSG